MKTVKPSVKNIYATPDAMRAIERAGRVCYRSDGKTTRHSAAPFVKRLIENGHESILEHATASFRVVTDRGVSHEIVRHRLSSFAQESTRFCNYTKKKFGGNILFIKPAGLTPQQEDDWLAFCERSERLYFNWISQGASPQQARHILPISLKTELVWTANFREWRTILKQRLSTAAHPHMQFVAGKIYDWFLKKYPIMVFDIVNLDAYYGKEKMLLLSKNHKTSKKELWQLAFAKEEEVRINVAKNKTTPTTLLHVLAKDLMEKVQKAALCAIGKRRKKVEQNEDFG